MPVGVTDWVPEPSPTECAIYCQQIGATSTIGVPPTCSPIYSPGDAQTGAGLPGDGYPKKAIEKPALRFLGSRTFSHRLGREAT
jgi:hypothetical protein